MKIFTYYSTQHLPCCDSCSNPQNAVVCVLPELTLNTKPYLDVTVLYCALSGPVCETQSYSYSLQYDETQLLDPTYNVKSSDISGIFCRDCLTTYIDAVAGGSNLGVPPVNCSYDLGNSLFNWRNIYTCGDVIYSSSRFRLYPDTSIGADSKLLVLSGGGLTGGVLDETRGAQIAVAGINADASDPLIPLAGSIELHASSTVDSGSNTYPSVSVWTRGVLRWWTESTGTIRFLGVRAGPPDGAPGDPAGLLIAAATPNGADNLNLSLSGGGISGDPTRGSWLDLAGNECSPNHGSVQIGTGNHASARIQFGVESPSGDIQFYTQNGIIGFYKNNNDNIWLFHPDGRLVQDPTFGSNILFSKDNTGLKYQTNDAWSNFDTYVNTPVVSTGYVTLKVGGVSVKLLARIEV